MTTSARVSRLLRRAALCAAALGLCAPGAWAAPELLLRSSATYHGGDIDRGAGLILVPDQNVVYIVGSSSEGAQSQNLWVGRYSLPDLVMESSGSLDGLVAGGMDVALGGALGPDGKLYLAGNIQSGGGAGGQNIVIIKLDSDLAMTFIASATFNGSGNAGDSGQGIVVSDGGNVFVTGQVTEGGANANLFVGKFNSNLVLLASATADGGSGADVGHGITYNSGSVYVVGTLSESVGGPNAWVAKYTADLVLVSSRSFNGSAGSVDEAWGVAFKNGVVLVAGQLNQGASDQDAWVASLNPASFVVVSSATFDGPDGIVDAAKAVGADSTGNVYLTGSVMKGGDSNIWVAQLNSSLVIISSTDLDGSAAGSFDEGNALVAQSAFGLIAAGETAQTGQMSNAWIGLFGKFPHSEILQPPGGGVYLKELPVISGTAQASSGQTVSAMDVSAKRLTDNFCYNGASFVASCPNFRSASFSGASSGTWTYNALADGLQAVLTNGTSYFLEAKAVDSGGAVQNPTVNHVINFDNALPTGAIQFPGPNEVVAFWDEVVGTANDLNSGVLQISLRISSGPNFSTHWNGAFWQSSPVFQIASGTGAWTFTNVPGPLALPGGTSVQLQLRVSDGANNEFVAISTFMFKGAKIWSGAGASNNASQGANWIGGAPPVAGDAVVFGSTAPTKPVLFDIGAQFDRIDILNGFGGTNTIDISSNIALTGDWFQESGQVFFLDQSTSHTISGPARVLGGKFHVGAATVTFEHINGIFVSTYSVLGSTLEVHDGGVLSAKKIDVAAGAVFRLFDNTGSGTAIVRSSAPGVGLHLSVNGLVDISSGIIERLDQDGLQIGPQAVIVQLSSFAFTAPLLPGTTAINFFGSPVIVATFTNVGFNSSAYGVNVKASSLSPSSRITMRDAYGPAAGTPFENDPLGVVDWVPEPGGGGGGGGFVFSGNFTTYAQVGKPGENVIAHHVAADTVTVGGPFVYALYHATTGSPGAFPNFNFIAKYDPAGVLLSSVALAGAWSTDRAFAMGPGPALFVGERSADESLKWIAKYDKNLVFQASVAANNQAVGNFTSLAANSAFLFAGVDGGQDNRPKVIKYDFNLVEQTSTTYVSGAIRNNASLAVDASGTVYAVVADTGPSGSTQFRLLKYNSGLPAVPDADADVTPLSSSDPRIALSGGNLYLVTVNTATHKDVYVRKFTLGLSYTGVSATMTATQNLDSEVAAVIGHGNDDVYVVAGSTEIGLRRFGGSLTLISSASVLGLGVAAGATASEVYVAGLTGSPTVGKVSHHNIPGGGGGGGGTFTGTFASAFGAVFDGGDEDSAIAVAANALTGEVYVVGSSSRGAAGEGGQIVRYSESGVFISSRGFELSSLGGGNPDFFIDVLVAPSGEVYAVNETQNQSQVMRFAFDLALLSSAAYSGDNPAIGLNGGFLYLATRENSTRDEILRKLDAANLTMAGSGVVSFTGVDVATRSGPVPPLTFGPTGEVYYALAPNDSASTPDGFVMLRFNASASFIASSTVRLPGVAFGGLSADAASGNIFVSYATATTGGFIDKLGSDFSYVSSTTLPGDPNSVQGAAGGVGIGPGGVYWMGGPGLTIRRYDASLGLLASTQPLAAPDLQFGTDLAVRASTAVYFTWIPQGAADWHAKVADLSGGGGPENPLSGIAIPTHTALIPSLAFLTGTATDNVSVAEVRVSIQRLSDGFFFDGASYSASFSSIAASGTGAWSLNLPSSVNIGSGTFRLVSYAKDGFGNAQTDFTVGIASITVTRKHNGVLNLSVLQRSSTTLEVEWNPNGNPAGTQYRVHFGTGNCDDAYFGPPSFFTPLNTSTRVFVNALVPDQSYSLHIHIHDAGGTDQTTGAPGDPGSNNITAVTRSAGLGLDSTAPLFVGCGGGGGGDTGSFGIVFDPSGNIWTVVADAGAFSLRKFNGSGIFQSSTTLPDATASGDWEILFVGGDSYAVGTSSNGSQSVNAAVYRVAGAGGLISSAPFNSSFNNNDYALAAATDSAGAIWVLGAIQTSGPTDEDLPGTREYAQALWKYEGGLLNLTTTFFGLGSPALQIGYGLAIDGSNEKWVLAYSSIPATPGPNKVALSLMRYNAAGTTLVAGPFNRPGYLKEFNEVEADLALSGGYLYATAGHIEPTGTGTHDLAFLKYDLSGSTVVEKFWHSSPSSNDIGRGLAVKGATATIVGKSKSPHVLSVWQYGTDGTLKPGFPQTVTGKSSGRAVALKAAADETWLAIEDLTPLQFFSGPGIAGAEGLDLGPQPPTSGITAPAHGSTLNNLSSVSGTASDADGSVAEVRISVQRHSDGYFFNGSSYTVAFASLPVTGTSSWSTVLSTEVNASSQTANLSVGSYTFVSYARDDGGLAQTSFAVGGASVSVLRNAFEAGSFAVTAHSSSTLSLSWTDNGNFIGTKYHIHFGTATSCTDTGPLNSDNYEANNARVLSGLLPDTTYWVAVHTGDDGVTNVLLTFTRSPGQGSAPAPAPTNCGGGGGGGGDPGGRAIALDGSGNIWMVTDYSGTLALAKHDSAAVFQSSVALPNAKSFNWSIAFDDGGNTYAAGASSSATTVKEDLTVYKVNGSGSVLLSSRTFPDPGFGLNENALEASSGTGGLIWIAGAIQTGGDEDLKTDVYRLGLWKYDTASGLLALATTYAGAGGSDGGLGLVVLPNQEKWVMGFSSNPARPGAGKADIALWRFSADGSSVVAGPFLAPGSIGAELDGELVMANGALYATALRHSPQSNLDLAFLKWDLNGNLLVDKSWHSTPPMNDEPHALAVDPSGNLYIAGDVQPVGGGEHELAIWKYSAAGDFVTAFKVSGVDKGRDLAIATSGTKWIATESTAPFQFPGGITLSGVEGLDGAGPPQRGFLEAASLAPPSAPASFSDQAMLRLGIRVTGGNSDLTGVRVTLSGDAPATSLWANLYKDDGDLVRDAGDTLLASSIPFTGAFPQAQINPAAQALTAATAYFFITVDGSGLPPGKTFGVKIEDPGHLTLSPGVMELQPGVYPAASSQTVVSTILFAKPQGPNYTNPSTAPVSGGFDTGFFIESGQTIAVDAVGSWSTGTGAAFVSADGLAGFTPGWGALKRGSLVGRVGGGNWFQLGASVVFTSTQTGTMFLAMSDDSYGDNSGSLTIQLKVQVSTAIVTWAGGGGSSGKKASIDANWVGGKKPISGEGARFAGAVDCEWDLSNFKIGLLDLTTGYSGTVTLLKDGPAPNTLQVASSAFVRGGKLNLGSDVTLTVEGALRVEGAVLDLGQSNTHLKVSKKGVSLSSGAFFRSLGSGFVTIEALGGDFLPFEVYNATVEVNNPGFTQFDQSDGVVISSLAHVAAFDHVNFQYFGLNDRAALVLHSPPGVPRSLTIRDTEFRVDVATNVRADGLAAGSAVTMLDAKGPRRGTPFERDPLGVVSWVPDGGGVATATGTLTYGGGQGGLFVVRASTSPTNELSALAAQTAPQAGTTYSLSGLAAPNTWYFFAIKDADGNGQPNGFEPRGGFGNPGSLRSNPVFLAVNTTALVNITLENWGAATGTVVNNSNQVGQIFVAAALLSNPATIEETVELGPAGGAYTLYTRATDYALTAFVDTDGDRSFDSNEASHTLTRTLVPLSTAAADFSITGGSAAAGGVLAVTPQSIHPGFVGDFGARGMLALQLSPSGGDAAVGGLALTLNQANPGSWRVEVFRDANQDGVLQLPGGPNPGGSDPSLGSQTLAFGASTASLAFFPPLNLASGATERLFLAFDANGAGVGKVVELSLPTTAALSLSQGSASVANFPVLSGGATIFFSVPANLDAFAPSGGGKDTGFFVTKGLSVAIQATGTWRPSDAVTVTPAGQALTEGVATILPGARVGELIGRISGDPNGWFRVGTSTARVAAESGTLFLAMNDRSGEYFNNSGEVFASFALSGSTTGAIAGTVSYVGGASGNLIVNALVSQTCPGCQSGPVVSTATVALAPGTTLYPYVMGGVPAGKYEVTGQISSNGSHRGHHFGTVEVFAGSTRTGVDFGLALGEGAIEGTLFYSGVQPFGPFVIAAATVTDFEQEVTFFANVSTPSAGYFKLDKLPTPQTYFVVAFRDGNNDGEPEGPEPFGVIGNSSGSISNLGDLFAPVFVDTGATVSGQSLSLVDRGMIRGKVFFQQAVSEKLLIVLAGRGAFGSTQFEDENAEFKFIASTPAGGQFDYSLDLLRPGTDYTVIAFLDADGDGDLGGGELFGRTDAPISVPQGGSATVDFTIKGATTPAAVANFRVGSVSTAAITFAWDATPGATAYHLLDSTGGFVFSLPGGTTSHADSPFLGGANCASNILKIRALNALGPGPTVGLGQTQRTLAVVPALPFVIAGSVGETSLQLGLGPGPTDNGSCLPLTFEVFSATGLAGPFNPSLTFTDFVGGTPATHGSLTPGTTYYFKARTTQTGGAATAFSGISSTRTLDSVAPSVSGQLSYAGRQTGKVLVQALTSSGPFAGPAGSVLLPNVQAQSYFLQLPPSASYFLRAFVDGDGDSSFDAGEDTGSFPGAGSAPQPVFVGAGPVAGKDFAIASDTVKPGPPTGLSATLSFKRVDLTWVAPALNEDGTALVDLAGFRVQRTTQTSLGFATLSTLTVSGATGVVSGTAFSDLNPVGGVDNIYRVIALDKGGNAGLPSAPLVKRPFTGGTISGSISSFTTITSGIFRVRLSTLSSPDAGFVAESTLNPFEFTGLEDRDYFLRGFRDKNNDGVQDRASEPSGTHGGTAAPFPIPIINGNTASGRGVTICDRAALLPNSTTDAFLLGTDCPALDKGPGHRADIWTFRVGGGAAGSLAKGSQIHLFMHSPAFSPELILLGPDGFMRLSNSDPNGAFIDFFVHDEGLWIVAATSFEQNKTGFYSLSLDVVGGFGGKINGQTSYSGGKTGDIYLQLFNQASEDNAFPFRVETVLSLGAFTISGLQDTPPGGAFFLRAFRDANNNGIRDGSDPRGAFGASLSSPTAITVVGGQASPANVSVTLSDPAVGSVGGEIQRSGSKSGPIRVEIGKQQCPECDDLEVVSFSTFPQVGASSYTYTVDFVPPATNYILKAFVDSNLNNRADALEPVVSSRGVTVLADLESAVDLTLRDPGFGTAGASSVSGTITYGGLKTGTLFIGFATDASLETFPYFVTQAATGSYVKSGIVGGTTYFMGAFIDANGNGEPDFEGEFQEPRGALRDQNGMIPIFVPNSSSVVVNLTLQDPPSGVIAGTATYNGAKSGQNLIVEAFSASHEEGSFGFTRIPLTTGVSSYTYSVRNLAAASDFRLHGFVDLNFNEHADNGEPSFFRETPVAVSSGAGASPTLVDLFIFDAGAGGGGGSSFGRLEGQVKYNGAQPGPIVVQVFTTSTFVGLPVSSRNAFGDFGLVGFSIDQLATGKTYFVRAFKDGNGNKLFDEAFEANTIIDGSGVPLTQDQPARFGLFGELFDPGFGATGVAPGSLAGGLQYKGTAASSGTIRVLLFRPGQEAPVRVSTFAFSTATLAYDFPNLDPGQYFVRGFLDRNNNFLPEAEEPLGCSQPSNGFFVSGPLFGADFELCDRAQLDTAPGIVTVATLTVSDCRVFDRPERPFAKLFTFAGRRGQSVSIEMEAVGFYDSYLYLFGPLGHLLTQDDEGLGNGNARILNFTLPSDGLFTIGASAFAGGVTGAFKLKFSGSSGSLGSIAGEVSYSGTQGGQVVVGLFNNPDFDAPNSFVQGLRLDGPGPFSFTNLASGASYYLGGFIDGNFNFEPDFGEDADVLGEFGNSAAIFLRSGQDIGGLLFEISPSTDGVGGTVTVSGVIGYNGSRQGALRVEFWNDRTFTGRPVSVRQIPTGVGPYDASVPGGQPYFLRAFIDANANFIPDPDEPQGVYQPRGQGAEAVFAPGSGSLAGIDFGLFDPGQKFGTVGQGFSGQGTGSLTPAAAQSGSLLAGVTAQILVGEAGIQSNGLLAFGVPPGFPFPQSGAASAPGFVAFKQTNPGGVSATVVLEPAPPGVPGIMARVTSSTPLYAGATAQFVYHNVFMPCFAAFDTRFFLGTASTGTVRPEPLFAGIPELTITAGSARTLRLRGGYFSLTQGATSQTLLLEGFDNCGNPAAAGVAGSVTMVAKRFEPETNLFVNAGALKFSSSTTGVFASSTTLPFSAGQSTVAFVAVSTAAGERAIEITSNLGEPVFGGLTILPGATLGKVTVSTLPFGGEGSSVTIRPGDPSAANQAFIRFALSGSLRWEVQISSVPFKTGVEPNPLWQSWGFGPLSGALAWDGRFSPWLFGGSRVPQGDYFVRVVVEGGVASTDTVRVGVISSQLNGQVVDSGATPNPPLSGVRVSAFGRFSGGFTQSDNSGGFAFGGLAAGSYQMVFEKATYLIGKASITIDASATIKGMAVEGDTLVVSSTSAGLLRVAMKRAPALILTPTLPAGTLPVAFDLWGGLQVHNASFTRVFNGPLRLRGGTTSFDDGGQWDPSLQAFVEKSQIRFDVPPDTYTIRAFLPDFDESVTTGVVVGQGARSLVLPPLTKRSVIVGTVTLPAGFNDFGTFVSVNAVPLSTTAQLPEGFGGVFLPAGVDTATYRVEGLKAGVYRLTGNAPGLAAVSIASVTVPPGVQVSTSLPPFADPTQGNLLVGTVSVRGDTSNFEPMFPGGPALRIFVNAWAPGSLNFGQAQVDIATNTTLAKSSFAITGLDPGVEYQVFAFLGRGPGDGPDDFDTPNGFPKRVTISTSAPNKNPEGSLDFEFAGTSGAIRGTIELPEGSGDFGKVAFFGKVVASQRPERVGQSVGDEIGDATQLPNFVCGNGAAPAGGVCPVSNATFTVTGLNTETYEVTFVYRTTGKSDTQRISVVNGSTTTASVDLRGSTFSISGTILNQINNPLFNTNQEIVTNAARVPLRDRLGNLVAIDTNAVSVPLSTASLARVIAIRQDFAKFGVSISTFFDTANSRVGFIQPGGTFTVRNLPPGVYLLTTEDLRHCATCSVEVPRQSRLVSVATAAKTGEDFTLSDGFTVAGTIAIDGGIKDSRNLSLRVLNGRREVVRSTGVLLGNAVTGTAENSVPYSFANLPAREFYTLIVEDSTTTPKYIGRPIKFPNPALSAAGLQSDLSGQDVSLKLAAYVTGGLKDSNTGERIRERNATLLAPNFEISATANPWVEGGFVNAQSSVAGRPIRADGSFLVGPLFPDTFYDLRLGQRSFDLAFLAQGSQNYAPLTVSGLKMQPAEFKDIGITGLNQGQSIKGKLFDEASTTTALGNIMVLGRPSFGTVALEVQTFSNPQGEFTLWASSEISRQYDLTVAPRGGNQAASGKVYKQVDLARVTVSTQPLTVLLRELLGSVTGQVTTADGEPLSYPFGDQKGFPAAAVFLQPSGVVPENPLGDIEVQTESDGGFTIGGLSTGTFDLRAASLGYAVLTASVTVSTESFSIHSGTITLSALTLQRGALVTGRITLADASAPSLDDVGGVAAASRDFAEFVLGSVEADNNANTVSGYTISGFKTGVVYDLVILPADEGAPVVFPDEGRGVSFAVAEATATKTLNLTYGRAKPTCVTDTKALGNNQFQIKLDCSEPLRNETSADNDLELVLTKSTAAADGTALAAPNGTGDLLGADKRFDSSRKQITAIYRAVSGESRFALKLKAAFSVDDPTTGENFAIEKVFDFFAGLQSAKKESACNIRGADVKLQPSQEDEDLGRDERFRAKLPPGAFQKCAAGDAGCDVDPNLAGTEQSTLCVDFDLRKAGTREQAEASHIAKFGFAPAHLRALDDPGAYPVEVFEAMQAYRTQASTGVNPLSAFYDILLPLGIRSKLGQPADITLSFNLAGATATANDLNVWFFNTVTRKFEIENANRRVDTVNKTITVQVDHFSTFVVLGSTPVLTAPTLFSGGEIAAHNFPNPSDCQRRTKSLDNQVGFVGGQITFEGTMIRYGLPQGDSAPLRIKVYNVAGEVVREISQGVLPGGRTYYTPWDCKNDSGRSVSSGVYIGQVEWGGRSKLFKMAIIKGSGL